MNRDPFQIEDQRKAASLRNMYFNRFLGIRYATALFFFVNLYWGLSLLLAGTKLFLIPAALFLFYGSVAIEHMRLYSTHTNDLPITKICYWVQLFLNIGLLILTFTPIFQKLFPFLADTIEARLLLATILLVGCLLCAFVLRRLHNIRQDRDRHFQRIEAYEKAMHI